LQEMIVALIVLAGAAVLQFFRGRNLNLQLLQFYMSESVNTLKPKDRNFVWLGGYIGCRAEFDMEDYRLEYTITMLPRHSLLYFPISLLTSRHDKLYLVFRLKRVQGEAHLIRKGYYRLRPKIENEIALRKERVMVGRYEYEALYDRKESLELLLKLINGFSRPDNIKHLSLTPSTKVLYVLMKPEVETFRKDLEYINNFVRENETRF